MKRGQRGGDPAEKLVRAFVALDLDAAMRGRLADLVDRLRETIPGVRWVRPEGVHLTLRFLGYARRDVLDSLVPGLRRAAEECTAGTATVGGLGMFPERGRARVLWVGINVPSRVCRLQEACESAAVAAGFEAESRPFEPHLTLGRWPDPAPRPALPAIDLGHAALETLVLYRSQPGPKGSVYTPLETFPLARPAGP